MNGEMRNLSNWFKSNKLSLNLTKTNYIIFDTKNIDHEYHIIIDDIKLNQVSNL